MPRCIDRHPCAGFSLIELAVVLCILALLSTGLIQGLAAQRHYAGQREALVQLNGAVETLLAFAMLNGRLPCPANATLASDEPAAGREDCALAGGHGVLPWATLGLAETDPWGQRLSYYAQPQFTAAVPPEAHAAFTLETVGNARIRDALATDHDIAADLPAVIVSHGQRGGGAYLPSGRQQDGAGGEESENADADLSFIAHPPTPEFDDQLAWIIPSLLKSRLVAVGKLP